MRTEGLAGHDFRLVAESLKLYDPLADVLLTLGLDLLVPLSLFLLLDFFIFSIMLIQDPLLLGQLSAE